ncbi:hypothetical protein GCM10011394_07160 [Luteimonas terricola]|uniref:Uncharacterized protein n=2 Tax=Luteimonas terricola TaxID=645597 RepID=A0ABQ2EAZ5_9GAMM|nr:hypothetical protein GCM10011394_07160 [Luteimonas terricola]
MRALHAQAVEQVPSRTLYALRVRRENAAKTPARPLHRAAGWWLAAACAAVFALAIGLRQPGLEPAPAGESVPTLAAATEAVEAATYDEGFAALDEDPDLFLWLAAQDSQILAME